MFWHSRNPNNISTIQSRETDRQLLAEKVAAFSGQPVELPGYTQKPVPTRRCWVDPDTKLKRKKLPPKPVTFKALADDMERRK